MYIVSFWNRTCYAEKEFASYEEARDFCDRYFHLDPVLIGDRPSESPAKW